MLKKLLIGLIVLLGIFVGVALVLPKEVHVERSIEIDRSPAVIYTLLNSYKTYNDWSPWAKRDPEALYTFSGPESGVGARMNWDGDPALVGTGSQEIIESIPTRLVRVRLDLGPQGISEASFSLAGNSSGGTDLTWSFDTDVTEGRDMLQGILGRYFGLFLDKWVGGDYEEGLANLKAYAESLPAADFTDLEVEIVNAQPQDILYVSTESSQDPDDIVEALASAYQLISDTISSAGLEVAGQPMAITRAWDENGYRFDAAIPVQMLNSVELPELVEYGQSPSGRAVRVIHRGSYQDMMPTYEKLAAYMATHGLKEGSVSWEHYISDPGNTDPEDLITYVYFLIEE